MIVIPSTENLINRVNAHNESIIQTKCEQFYDVSF